MTPGTLRAGLAAEGKVGPASPSRTSQVLPGVRLHRVNLGGGPGNFQLPGTPGSQVAAAPEPQGPVLRCPQGATQRLWPRTDLDAGPGSATRPELSVQPLAGRLFQAQDETALLGRGVKSQPGQDKPFPSLCQEVRWPLQAPVARGQPNPGLAPSNTQ